MVRIKLKGNQGPNAFLTLEEFIELDSIPFEIAMLYISSEDGRIDIEEVQESYPALCSALHIDQMFFGDIATMILYNCFLTIDIVGNKK